MKREILKYNESSETSSVSWRDELLFVSDVFSFLKHICTSHWKKLPILVAGFLGLGAAMIMVMPKNYMSDATLLVKKNSHMASLTYPMRTILEGIDKPLASAEIIITDEDLLHKLVTELKLVDSFYKQRPLFLKIKDRFLNFIIQVSEKDKTKAIIKTLKKNIVVKSDGEKLEIIVKWFEPRTARDIADKIVVLFLKARHRYEVETVQDTVAILKTKVIEVDERIESRLKELRLARLGEEEKLKKLKDQGLGKTGKKKVDDQTIQNLKGLLLEKRAYLENIERAKRQKVAELQIQLNQLKSVLNPSHPDILELEATIETLLTDRSDLESIKKEETALLQEFQSRGGVEADLVSTQGGSLDAAFGSVSKEDLPSFEKDEMITYARGRLRIDMDLFEDLNRRLENAYIELETAKEAFKYRYNIISPPEVPKKAVSPKAFILISACGFLGFMTWLFIAVFLELISFKITQNWQTHRLFGIKSLGEVKL